MKTGHLSARIIDVTMTNRKVTWHWHDEDNYVLYIDYKHGWTWDEHHLLMDEMTSIGGGDETQQFVYVIIDMLDTSFPKGVPTNTQKRDIGSEMLAIIVTNNGFVRTIGQMGVKILGDHSLYQFVKTVDEAETIIEEHRTKQKTLES